MIKPFDFANTLFVSAIAEIDYLFKMYCRESSYLTLDDLRHKHKEYLFNIIQTTRRCLETQIFNVNNPGIGVYTSFNQLLTLCLDYYRGIDTVKSTNELWESCENMKKSYEEIIGSLRSALSNNFYTICRDLSTSNISRNSWEDVATKARSSFSIKGHHLNVLIPYPKEDVEYTRNFEYFLRNIYNESTRQFYSFYTENLDSRLFISGQYLHTNRERVNMRTKSFDVVIVTHNNMFDDVRPRINTAAGYMKQNGAMIILGLSTDFRRLDLRRISSVLQDINVYFYTTQQTSSFMNDNELCVVIGHRKNQESPSEYARLLDIFALQTSEEKPFTFYGSDQEERPLFASYDISEAEATVLIPDMRNITNKLLTSLLPKTIVDTRRPLLPFSSGQLGLVLISGDINGMIEENDTKCRHIVKGSSKQRRDDKTEVLETDSEGRPTRTREVESVYASTNVNIVLPSGDIVELH